MIEKRGIQEVHDDEQLEKKKKKGNKQHNKQREVRKLN